MLSCAELFGRGSSVGEVFDALDGASPDRPQAELVVLIYTEARPEQLAPYCRL